MTPNLVGIFKTKTITFVIDFDSEILTLILKKNEFHEHHYHVKHNFIIDDYQKWYPNPDPDRNLCESKN